MWMGRACSSSRAGAGGPAFRAPAPTCPCGRDGSGVDMGDQFIAVAAGRTQPPDRARHFGLVVDDKEGARAGLKQAGVDVQASGSLDFFDPWGTTYRSSTTATSSSPRLHP